MAMNPIPPQAYTKDTLLKAYAWLQNQSLNIKDMATTTDILISLYLKANRDGDSSLERPSIQNFKNELKSLAGLMGELEAPQQTTALNASHSSSRVVEAPTAASVTAAISSSLQSQLQAQIQSQNHTQNQIQSPAPNFNSARNSLDLDAQSKEMIREVKAQLNLSSESEALRAIIRLGHLQISRLFR